MQNYRFVILVGLILLSWSNAYAEHESTLSSDPLRKSRFFKEVPASVMEGIKINNKNHTENQFCINHFYQRINEDGQSGWMQSSAQLITYTKYLRISLNADQGVLFQQSNGLSATKITHRFGMQIDQASLNKNLVYFGMMGASGSQFAQFSFIGGFSWLLSSTLDACFEVQGASYSVLDNFLSMRTMLVKNYLSHQLSIKPSFSYTDKWQVNISMSDKFFMSNKSDFILMEAGTGYSLDRNLMVSYGTIRSRCYYYFFGGDLSLSGTRTSFLPKVGFDFIKGSNGKYYLSYGVQFGIKLRY